MKSLAHLLLNASVCISLLCFSAKAQMTSGSEITYACTSTPGEIEVTLVLYKSCQSSSTPLCTGNCNQACTQPIKIMGADPGCASSSFGTINVSLVNVRDANTSENCPNAMSTCTNLGCKTPGTFIQSHERYEYKGIANIGSTSGIPATCCNVRFAWQSCCRSASINTGMAWQNVYNDAIINRCLSLSPCNNSPTFITDPKQAICGGQNFIENISCFDKEGDSLSYAFAPALQSFGSSVTYNPPYAFDRPMPWTGSATGLFPAGIRCDPVTGDVLFTPSNISGMNFTGNITVEVKQWRNINKVPTVIGMVRRDVEVTVLGNCTPNNPPRLTTNPPALNNPNAPRINWEICAGEQLCFTVTAKDTDFIPPTISDTTWLKLNEPLSFKGYTFNRDYLDTTGKRLNGPREDSYRFCWTPHDSDARSYPYFFSIKAYDSKCPKPSTISSSFSIRVRNKPNTHPISVALQKTDNGCGNYTFQFNHADSLNKLKYNLLIANNPDDKNFSSGTFTLISSKSANHYFNQNGKFYVYYGIENLNNNDNNNLCNHFVSAYDSVTITSSSGIEITSTIVEPTCYNKSNGSIQVSLVGNPHHAPFNFALNNQPFDSTSSFVNLYGGIYTINVRNSVGCIRSFKLDVTRPLPVLDSNNLTFNDDMPQRGKIIPYYLWSFNYNPTTVLGWRVTNGTFQSDSLDPRFRNVLWGASGQTGTLMVIAKNGFNCIDTLVKTFFIMPPDGLNDLAKELGLKVFPNPIQNVLNIELAKLPEEKTMKLYDLQGRLLLSKPLQTTMEIDMRGIQQGLYMLQIGNWYGRVVKE